VFSSLDTIPTKRPKRSLASNVSALASTAPSSVKSGRGISHHCSLPHACGGPPPGHVHHPDRSSHSSVLSFAKTPITPSDPKVCWPVPERGIHGHRAHGGGDVDRRGPSDLSAGGLQSHTHRSFAEMHPEDQVAPRADMPLNRAGE